MALLKLLKKKEKIQSQYIYQLIDSINKCTIRQFKAALNGDLQCLVICGSPKEEDLKKALENIKIEFNNSLNKSNANYESFVNNYNLYVKINNLGNLIYLCKNGNVEALEFIKTYFSEKDKKRLNDISSILKHAQAILNRCVTIYKQSVIDKKEEKEEHITNEMYHTWLCKLQLITVGKTLGYSISEDTVLSTFSVSVKECVKLIEEQIKSLSK